MYRIGNGYDVHQLKSGEKIRLGGIEIPSKYEIIAHSDGDIVIHALMDAILGALGEDDIGKHFPDTDEQYKNADSTLLLKRVDSIMKSKGYEISNADITIVLERPKLRAYIDKMKKSLTKTLKIDSSKLNIKATTSEKMGFVGTSKGIECYAVCLLKYSQ